MQFCDSLRYLFIVFVKCCVKYHQNYLKNPWRHLLFEVNFISVSSTLWVIQNFIQLFVLFGCVCFFNSVSHFLKIVKFIYIYIYISFFCRKIRIVSTSYKNSKCTFTVIRRAKLSQTGIRCYLWDIDILEQRLYLAYKIVLYNFSTAISRNTHKIYTLVSSCKFIDAIN